MKTNLSLSARILTGLVGLTIQAFILKWYAWLFMNWRPNFLLLFVLGCAIAFVMMPQKESKDLFAQLLKALFGFLFFGALVCQILVWFSVITQPIFKF